MSNILHSNKTPEWYTPEEWITRAREVLGHIELDPASCHEAQKVVQAERYYDKQSDGLSRPWYARSVWLNPPSGRGAAKAWFNKLLHHWYEGHIGWAIYLAYNLEQIRYLPIPNKCALVAIPHKRIAFRGAGSSPTHSNAFVYLSSEDLDPGGMDKFASTMGETCTVYKPWVKKEVP